jgi:hypothetical protein
MPNASAVAALFLRWAIGTALDVRARILHTSYYSQAMQGPAASEDGAAARHNGDARQEADHVVPFHLS